MKRFSILIIVLALLFFLFILSFTSLLGDFFGKKAEMTALIAIAGGLAIALYFNNRDKGDEQ